MFKYISSFSVDTLHEMVNRGFLEMACRALPFEQITVYCTKSTINRYKSKLGNNGKNLLFKQLRVNNRNGKIALLTRYVQSAFYNIRILVNSKKDDILFYNFNNVFSLEIINFLSLHFFKKRKIITICHGELEYLANSSKHNKTYKKFLAWMTKKFFFRKTPSSLSPDFHFIVLGDIIKTELSKILPNFLLNRIYSIDHPIIEEINSQPSPYTLKTNSNIKEIGTVGILNEYKGAETYIEVVRRLKDNNLLSFNIVGQVQHGLEEFKDLGVKMAQNPTKPLLDSEYSKLVNNLDYILLLYPSDNYRLIASGALLDTIKFKKPFIGISTKYFKYFFEKFGQLGILVEDKSKIINVLENLSFMRFDKINYEEIIKKLSPEALAPEFEKILISCGVNFN